MQTIQKTVSINAPKSTVWKVLTTTENYALWASASSPNGQVETDWQEGSKVAFTDESQSGLVGRIIKHVPNEIISFEYDGELINGVPDFTSKGALQMKGIVETYRVTDANGATKLDISLGMPEEYLEMMSTAWDKALQIIKDLAEASV